MELKSVEIKDISSADESDLEGKEEKIVLYTIKTKNRRTQQ